MEATAQYMTRAAEKLRKQQSIASHVHVFLHTNSFKLGEPQYSNTESIPLVIATSHTPTLIKAAQAGLKKIYREGYAFKKSGVILSGLEPLNGRWLNMLELPPDDRPDRKALMQAVDALNARWGRDTVSFAASGIERSWKMKREMRSPRYTTIWEELLNVRAD